MESQCVPTCPSHWKVNFCICASVFWPARSREFGWLQPEHHLTVKLCPYTIMNWSWKSICCLMFTQYHLFDLDCASVEQNPWVNGQRRICLQSLFVVLMKTQEVNSIHDLSMAKVKEACYRRWNRRRETQGIQDIGAGNLSLRVRENLIPGESGRAAVGPVKVWGVDQVQGQAKVLLWQQDEVSLQWD